MLTPEKAQIAVNEYFSALAEKFRTGQAREHAYRPVLEKLMKDLDQSLNVLNDPARSEHGNPDFIFLRGDIMVGHAETKDIGVSLSKTENSEQLSRYFGYANLYLTDYLEFRFFKNGARSNEPIVIGTIKDGQLVAHPERFAELATALADFVQGKPQPIKSGKRLAEIMGGKARRLRDNVQQFLGTESEKNAELMRIYETIKKLLVHDLSIEKFADMYAQTLVYGLFVARYNDNTPENFSRQEARELVPESNPFLREFFDHIAGTRFDKRLGFIVDELCAVFTVSDLKEIVHRHLKVEEDGKDEKDPIIHFYEDFLHEYDPAERKKMGAYYTPLPVVRFIVRAVDEALKRDFGLPKGLADTSKRKVTVTTQGMKPKEVEIHRVQILDPAVGTATFLNEIIKHVAKDFKGQEGRWCSYVESDLMPRLHGFELMMAPYTIAHLKLAMTLQEAGCGHLNQRLGVYLTNTLEEGVKVDDTLFGLGLSDAIAKEAEAAGKIKHEKPIMVIVGNPPYSGESSNKTDYAMSLVAKYKFEPGGKEKLKERNPKWINDDYVKFIAFAEDMIEKTGEGIVAMITNHGYLDNPTFRGMRWHLAETFDKLYILDLHGNAKKKETSPDGSKDENVFAIQQGVSIIVAVKTGKKKIGAQAAVMHADLFGTRVNKFSTLNEDRICWIEIKLDEKFLFFANKNTEGKEEYDRGISITDLFLENSVGIVTGRDELTIDYSREDLWRRVQRFADLDVEDARSEFHLGKDARDWQVDLAQKDIRSNFSETKLESIYYRPFDVRWTYYTGNSRGFYCYPRYEVMQHFLKGENVGLDICRQNISQEFSHVFVTDRIADDSYVSNKSRERGYVLPLFIYREDGERVANFDPETIKQFTASLEELFDPENVLDYIYAILYSPAYRTKYMEFLKTDFPRVPVPENDKQFHALAEFGKQLRELHLLTSPKVHDFITTYPKEGSNLVEKLAYKDGNVWINANQYFGGVPEIAWNFYIGGYQPAQKWLKDRKGRALENKDIEHYQQMIVALAETDKIMKEIDTVAFVRLNTV
ncbi:MAG: type ISP restriction/modification enzyme [Patescibacteria group bacterium]|jgi:predicted helicase